MNWIEKLFGVAPDGGDGSAELAILLLSLAVATIVTVFLIGLLRRVTDVRR